ncbi:MAG: STAS/SEC14 domain-containing protein [Flavobacterium sp.]|nr:MAG: STAS/SEC14 domain-containing protein [Flavobacterium sp.]
MVEILKDIPNNVAGFRASGAVKQDDYVNVVIPFTEEKLRQTGEINFLLLIDTDLSNFTFGAWLNDALLGIKHLTKWRKAAIITDNEVAIKFTDGFSVVAPGEFKGFLRSNYEAAVRWVST